MIGTIGITASVALLNSVLGLQLRADHRHLGRVEISL